MAAIRRHLLLLLGVSALVAPMLLAAAYAYDRADAGTIARGVTIDGVPVGGLDSAHARTRLQKRFAGPLRRETVRVADGTRTWSLPASVADVNVDAGSAVASALSAGRSGSFIGRALRGVTGGRVARDVPLRVDYSHDAVRAFDASIRAAVSRPATDASVSPTSSGLDIIDSSDGVAVSSDRLGAAVEHALADPHLAARPIALPTQVLHPTVTRSQLAAAYPAYIVVDRPTFSLRLYEHLRLTHTYPIAVGMQAHQTPAGLYHVQWKQVDPPWYVPNSAWAGSLAGKTIPPGPDDPLKARFMSFDGSAGIHGIAPAEYGTIGHYASHGCVRMRIPDVIALYARTPVGTPVYII